MVKIKEIVKEFEQATENMTIGAMAYAIGKLRERVEELERGETCAQCAYWRDDNSCAVNIGVVYKVDERCSLFCPSPGE